MAKSSSVRYNQILGICSSAPPIARGERDALINVLSREAMSRHLVKAAGACKLDYAPQQVASVRGAVKRNSLLRTKSAAGIANFMAARPILAKSLKAGNIKWRYVAYI